MSVCGIGNPAGFVSTLERMELEIKDTIQFPDHHNYAETDIQRIAAEATAQRAEAIVCTHKDLVKIGANQIGSIPVFALIIDVAFDSGEQELAELVLKTARNCQSDPNA